MRSMLRPCDLMMLLALSASACAPKAPPLPVYPGADDATALRILGQRADSIRSVTAKGSITLVRADGESVQFDGVIVMAPPDKLRLRAWKFSQAAFDLTLTSEGLWIMMPDDPSRRQKVLPATVSAEQFIREWRWLSGGFFSSSDLRISHRGGSMLVKKTLEDGRELIAQVQQPTLVPERYRMLDEKGAERFSLTLQQYRDYGSNIVWPSKLIAESESGKILLDLREVEINAELAPRAFVPPRRAERRR